MLQPTPDALASLPPPGRLAIRMADLLARAKRRPINDAFMGTLIWISGGRRIRVHGLEHILRFTTADSLLLVANHRSFFDFFLIKAILTWKTDLARRCLFPVRKDFFYEHPLGPFINLAMSGMRMFPPLTRAEARAPLNKFALDRCVAELEVPGMVLGVHPEGTRSKADDPYELLPAQPGVGKLALDAKNARVVPIFVVGMTSNLAREFALNWSASSDHPIDLMFGPEIDLTDLREGTSRLTTQKRAADRCLAGIAKLAETHRATMRD